MSLSHLLTELCLVSLNAKSLEKKQVFNVALWFQDLARVVPLTAARFCNYQFGTHCAKHTCLHWNESWKNNHLQTPTVYMWMYTMTLLHYILWVCVIVCTGFVSVCECTLNTCCDMCICAFLDFCQETCYVDITLCIAVISRWQHEKRWDLCKWLWEWREVRLELKQGKQHR